MDALVHDGAAALPASSTASSLKTLAFNVVPMLGAIGEEGYTDEELKLRNESRKILGIPELAVSPDLRARAGDGRPRRSRSARRSSATSTSTRPTPRSRAFPNLVVEDVPTPLEWAGRDETAVGRIRRDLADPEHSLNFFVVGDNLLKGAALNTVQLAELLHERGLVRATARA